MCQKRCILWSSIMPDFTVLNNLNNTVRKLQESVNKSIQESIKANDAEIKQLQTSQLYSGKNKENQDIKPSYAFSTIRIKRQKGQPTDRVTLRDTGDFYRSLEIVAGGNAMIIRTILSYSIFLINKYADILGLTADNWQSFIEQYTIPIIKKNFDDIIAES